MVNHSREVTGIDPTAQPATILWLPSEEAGLKDFWHVYEAHYDEILQRTTEALSDDPDFGPLIRSMPPQQMAESNRRSRELMRRAIVHGDWKAYLDDLRSQGSTYARAGLKFAAWFAAVGAFRNQLRPHLFEAFGKTPDRLAGAFDAMNKFVDRAMAVIGEEYLAAKEKIILQQQEALRELSTPVLQVRDRMLLLPIVGLVDTFRARQLTEQLLRAIRTNRAKVVVIDITGVPAVDSKVANHLLQTVEAARLMGTFAIVTGLSADVAQSLVTLGVDLRSLNTFGDLQGGLEEAERISGYQGNPAGGANGHLTRPLIGERARE
jgi:rsbT co-antagonist protein RsbR